MTKKHFEAMARIIKDHRGFTDESGVYDAAYRDGIDNLTRDMADYFAQENPRFDREKFLTACGLGE